MPKTIYSFEHAISEFAADKEQLRKYLGRLVVSRKYRLAIKDLNRFRQNVYFKPFEWKSARKNEYLILIGVASKADAKSHGLFALPIMLCLIEGQMCAMTQNNYEYRPFFEFFKYHFFKRYNERFLIQPDLELKDVIHIFFKNNSHNCYRKMESKKFDNNYAFIYPDGVGFGKFYTEKKYCIHNTFVTRMMLYKQQKEMTNDMLEFIDAVSTKSFAELRDNNIFRYIHQTIPIFK